MKDFERDYEEFQKRELKELEELITTAVRKSIEELGNMDGKIIVIAHLQINICRGTSANQRIDSPGNDRHHSSPGHDVFVSEELTPFAINQIGKLPIPKDKD